MKVKIPSDRIEDAVPSRVVPIRSEDTKYDHICGGSGIHHGATPKGLPKALHHIYTFDTTDPKFPFKLSRRRYLPLFYGFAYNAGACAYRVVSDSKIKVIYMETEEVEPDFPYPGYPDEFVATKVEIQKFPYEAKKLFYATIVDEYCLNEADEDQLEAELGSDFTQIGGHHRLTQGPPQIECKNPKCIWFDSLGSLEVFATVWNQPHEGIQLWSKEECDDIQVIFQICTECGTIHASNRCS